MLHYNIFYPWKERIFPFHQQKIISAQQSVLTRIGDSLADFLLHSLPLLHQNFPFIITNTIADIYWTPTLCSNPVLSVLILSYLNLTSALCGQPCYCDHFTDKEAKAQRAERLSQSPADTKWWFWGSDSSVSYSKGCHLRHFL